MPPEKLADRWRRKAAEDLQAAETLLRASDPPVPYPLVCFHAQQAAEKSLKGWRVSRRRPAPRTHNWVHLILRAAEVEPSFMDFRKAAAKLTPFAVAPRYPGDLPEPGEDEARRAVEGAKEIRDFVERLGPPGPEQALPLT